MSFQNHFQLSSKIMQYHPETSATVHPDLDAFLHHLNKPFNISTRPCHRVEIQVPKEEIYVVRTYLAITFGQLDDSVTISEYIPCEDSDD